MNTPARASTGQQSSTVLLQRLAEVLPQGYRFGVHHLSTPPTKCDALCSAPPDERPDRTYSENHFLAVSIPVRNAQSPAKAGLAEAEASLGGKAESAENEAEPRVFVLALEVYIFTTAYSSIFFVSKADSTGYLHLLNLPKGTPSPIREISATFVSYLVEQRRRPRLQSVVTLFARAQSQYLFPGSVKNGGKHVLDDRGLVKWWCRVLNPLVESPPGSRIGDAKTRNGAGHAADAWGEVKAYLIIPGLDKYETRAFVPRTTASAANWVFGHPLAKMSHYTREYDWVPARCLIPRYPDDPKSRFRDDLDEEAAKSKVLLETGSWKSVATVDQFWELMAFRQECSSGRMTGFIWVVFDPPEGTSGSQTPISSLPAPPPSSTASTTAARPSTPTDREPPRTTPFTTPRKLYSAPGSLEGTPSKKKPEKKKKKPLSGRIRPRQPHIKTRQRNYLLDRAATTAYYHWPAEGRGRQLVDESGYKRAVELLLHLDFANLELAVGSTRRWLNEVGMGTDWAMEVVGTRVLEAPSPSNGSTSVGAAPAVNVLTSFVKRKRSESATVDSGSKTETTEPPSKVNVLSSGLVRKKPKDNQHDAETRPGGSVSAPGAVDGNDAAQQAAIDTPKVNVLGMGLVRKKPKA